MTAPAASGWMAVRPRLATWLAMVGIAGLSVAIFMDQGASIGVPWNFFDPPDLHFRNGLWTALLPFLFAVVLLLVRTAVRAVDRASFSVASGWTVAAVFLVLFIVADLAVWRRTYPFLRFWSRADLALLLFFGNAGLMGLATLSLAALCAVPAQTRLAAAGTIAGFWGAYFFGVLIYADNTRPGLADIFLRGMAAYQGHGPSRAPLGLYVSFVSSALLASGGTWETLRLWRAEEDETPRVRPTFLRFAAWLSLVGMVGLFIVLCPLLNETARRGDMGLEGAQWVLLTPWLFAVFLLFIRFTGLWVPETAAGQAAVGACLVLFVLMDVDTLLNSYPWVDGFFRHLGPGRMAWAVIGLMLAATLATAALWAAPARFRFAACEVVVGIWSACLLACSMIFLTHGDFSKSVIDRLAPLRNSLLPAVLVTAGGIWQIILLRRSDASAEGTQ